MRVQGETYADKTELAHTVADLDATLATMNPDSEQYESLDAHLDMLRAALFNGDAPAVSGRTAADALPTLVLADELPQTDDAERAHADDDEDGDEEVAMCPTCGADWPFPDEPPVDPYAVRCDDCKGWGVVATGSRVPGYTTRNCLTCNGEGFKPTDRAAPPPPAKTAADVPEAPGAMWNPEAGHWSPPEGQQPPWAGAVWDTFYGKWA